MPHSNVNLFQDDKKKRKPRAKTERAPNKYAQFVKAHYHSVSGATPQDKMVAVAELWRKHKLKGGSVRKRR